MSYYGFHHVIIITVVNSNVNGGLSLGSLLPDGQKEDGFLGKAIPPPGRYNFTRNFTISNDWTNVCLEENDIVSIM